MKPSGRTLAVVLTMLIAMGGCQRLQPLAPALAPPATPAPRPSATPLRVETATSSHGADGRTITPAPSVVTITPAPPDLRNSVQDGAMRPDFRGDLATLNELTHYAIDLAIDFENLTFEGRAVVDYTNLEATPLDRLNFRLLPNGRRSYGRGSLNVSGVTLDGEPVEPGLSLEDTVLEIRLPAILRRHQSSRIILEFQGTVPRDFGEPDSPSGYGIYNFTDDVMALAGWYPILAVFDDEGWNLDLPSDSGDSVYSDAAFYTVDVTTRSDLVVVATGVEVGRQSSDGRTRYRFVSGPARDFFVILSPDFVKVTDSVDGTAVNSYYRPGHAAGGKEGLQIATDALRTFTQHFGPYPFTELDLVDAPMKYAAGVEFPGIILVGDFLFDDHRNPFFAVATSHEVAHQWWYNVVGNDVIDEPWLDEALTTFSSAVYFEAVRGEGAYQQNLQQWRQGYDQAVEKGQDDLVTQPMRHWDQPENRERYGTIVYLKGALFFQAVRQAIGDDAFFQALRDYYQARRYQIATTDDLLNAFEEAAGRQLDDLYQEWLYSAKS